MCVCVCKNIDEKSGIYADIERRHDILIRIHVDMPLFVCIHMNVCMYVCVYIHIYIHTYTNAFEMF
jgi:hypothetical protein